jgi:hypothetical protein
MKSISESVLKENKIELSALLNQVIFLNNILPTDNKELIQIETEIIELKKKIQKSNELLAKYISMKSEMQQKFSFLEEEIISKKIKLLEELGSEL